MSLFVPLGTPEVVKNRMLLRDGDRREWWTYESENPPGYTASDGTTYAQVTWSIRLPGAKRERVLTGDEVQGYMLCLADQWDVVDEIAYRLGLTDNTPA